jgi:hypothetical protein
MSDQPNFTGPEKPNPEQIKQEIIKRLNEIDLEILESLTGHGSSDMGAETHEWKEWTRVVWRVWER